MKLNKLLTITLIFTNLVISYTQNRAVKLSIESFYSDAKISKSTEYDSKNFRDVYPFDPNDYVDRGIEKFEEGFYKEALTDFNESIKLAPDCAYCHYLRGINFIQLDSISNAKNDLISAIKHDPLLIEAYNDLSYLYIYENKLDSAKNTLKKGIKFYPSYALTYYNLGIVEILSGKSKKAIKQIKHSLERDSCYSPSMSILAAIYLYDNKLSKAENQLNNLIKCKSDNANTYLLKALINAEKKRNEDAIDNLTKAISLNDTIQSFYATRGYLNIKIKNYDQAILDFKRAYELDPIETKSYRNNYKHTQYEMEYILNLYFLEKEKMHTLDLDDTFCLLLNGEYNKARKNIKKKTKKSNNNTLLILQAITAEKEKKYKEALDIYTRIIENDPNFYEAYRKRGLLRQSAGDYIRAIEDFNMMYKKHPNTLLALKYRAIAKVKNNKYSDALDDFNYFIDISKKDSDIYYNKGQCEMQMKLYSEAIISFEKVLSSSPYDLQAMLNIASCHSVLGDFQNTISVCDTIISYYQCHMKALNYKGIAYIENEKYEKALLCYNKMLECLPRDLDALTNRSVVLMKLRRHKEAITDIDKVINLYPKLATPYYIRANLKLSLKDESACNDLNKAIKLGFKISQVEINKICKK